MRALLSGGRPVTHAGAYYRLNSAELNPPADPALAPRFVVSGSSPASVRTSERLGGAALLLSAAGGGLPAGGAPRDRLPDRRDRPRGPGAGLGGRAPPVPGRPGRREAARSGLPRGRVALAPRPVRAGRRGRRAAWDLLALPVPHLPDLPPVPRRQLRGGWRGSLPAGNLQQDDLLPSEATWGGDPIVDVLGRRSRSRRWPNAGTGTRWPTDVFGARRAFCRVLKAGATRRVGRCGGGGGAGPVR